MFLIEFILTNSQDEVIRQVIFKKGMNIILGEAVEGDANSSTNSLGKTTLIRCIDFCLGAENADLFYKDNEFKNSNNTIKEFLTKQNPTFTLVLTPEFDSQSRTTVKRALNLSNKTKKEQIKNYINDEEYSIAQFRLELQKLLFGHEESKPSLRQLIGKFIRKDDNQIRNMLRFSHVNASDADYEKIHLFLLGFTSTGLLSEKASVDREIEKLKKIASSLNADHSSSALEQAKHILEEDYNKLKKQIDEFNIQDDYEEETRQLEQIQSQLNQTMAEISDIRLQINFDIERVKKLSSEHLNFQKNELYYLYQEAEYFSDKLAQNFEQLIVFHNTMLDNEIAYLKNKIESKQALIPGLEKRQNEIREKYNKLLAFLGQTGSLAEYSKLNEKLQELSRKLGENQALQQERTAYAGKIDLLKTKKEGIDDEVKAQLSRIDDNLKIFNHFFSEYTEELDSEKYLLAYEKSKSSYKFSIKQMNMNPGSGLKQAIVIAFDLAYMAFSNQLKLQRPLFATTDKIEIVDIEKLKILIDLANRQNGQFIAPCIKDKVAEDFETIKDDVILTLNSDNKFFRIEN